MLGVATAWGEGKGLYDYYKLADALPEGYQIVLVGLKKTQIESLPDNIIGIERTSNVQELVFLYNIASVLTSLSYGETFGLTLVEAMACGTPVVAYNNTGQAALVTPEVGELVETGNVSEAAEAIKSICENGKPHYSAACRKRAEKHFNKDACFSKYIDLYNNLINA